MSTDEKAANIVCFLAILFGESSEAIDHIMGFSPNYLVEKFDRYIMSGIPEHDWGMHPNLRKAVFNRYMQKWGLKCK